MPRLLLVDDNPSIHRIAESLLAPTDVELVCVDSAAEALDRLGRGERFDVALVDTAMPGMDGWTLLSRLRAMEETALMPIALMAGVLDPVDPSKLAKAPIQGFLKKPIELRELGDRVKALLATPVTPVPSPFSTVPATPAKDLVQRAEAALPEFRPEPEPVPEPMAADEPETILSVDLDGLDPEEDLLVLTAEDLWPEETVPAVTETESAPLLPDVHLELEELDLDSLQDLAIDPLPAEAAPVLEAAVEPLAAPEPDFTFDPGPVPPEDEDEELVTLSGLEDLDSLSTDLPASALAPEATPEPITPTEEPFTHFPEAAAVIGAAALAGVVAHEAVAHHSEPTQVLPEPETVPDAVTEPEAPGPAASGQTPAAPGQAAAATSDQARAVVQALLADPVLVDALVKAVVARMGDQVLREIAWEVMPDLAGRLQR